MKLRKGIIISSVLLGVAALIGGIGYNTWRVKRDPFYSYYYDGEFIGKTKNECRTDVKKYTDDDLSNKEFFMIPWYEKSMMLKRLTMDCLNLREVFGAKAGNNNLYSRSVCLEDLVYIGNQENESEENRRSTVATYFNFDDSGVYKLVGFPLHNSKVYPYYSSRWIILYDFKDTIGKDTGIVQSKLMYMSDTSNDYTLIYDYRYQCRNNYLSSLDNYDACYNIDFRYNRFDSEVSEFVYNENIVPSELITMYKEMLTRNLNDYIYSAKLTKDVLIKNGFSYYTDKVDIKMC